MKIKLLLLFSVISFCLNAQADYVTGITRPGGVVIIGNDLYFTQRLNANLGRISKVDITSDNPTVIDVVTGLNDPIDLVNVGNQLYFIESFGGLYKVDLNQNNPTAVFMTDPTGSSDRRLTGINIKDDFIYLSLFHDSKIISVNRNSPSSQSDIVTGIDFPQGIDFKGNDMYYIFWINNETRISKVDITDSNLQSTIVESSQTSAQDIQIIGNYLYFNQDGNVDDISRVDISGSLPANSSTVISGIDSNSSNFVIKDDKIYISRFINPGGRIQRYTAQVLDLENFEFDLGNLEIFPNPVSSIVNIELKNNKAIESIVIYNLRGQKIIQQNNSNNSVDVSSLSAGIYFIKVKADHQILSKKLIIK